MKGQHIREGQGYHPWPLHRNEGSYVYSKAMGNLDQRATAVPGRPDDSSSTVDGGGNARRGATVPNGGLVGDPAFSALLGGILMGLEITEPAVGLRQ